MITRWRVSPLMGRVMPFLLAHRIISAVKCGVSTYLQVPPSSLAIVTVSTPFAPLAHGSCPNLSIISVQLSCLKSPTPNHPPADAKLSPSQLCPTQLLSRPFTNILFCHHLLFIDLVHSLSPPSLSFSTHSRLIRQTLHHSHHVFLNCIHS